MNGPFFRKYRQNILNKFQKTVDLFKFIIPLVYDPPLFGLHTEIDQKIYRNILF